MIYINPTLTGTAQDLVVNSRAEGGVELQWTITREGNDTPLVVFNSSLTDYSFYQILTVTISNLGVSFDDEVMYNIKAVEGSELVYKGLLYSTSQVLPDYSVNDGQYNENSSTNDYIFLD